MRSLLLCSVLAVALVAFVPTTAMAGPWTNPSGEADHFWYSNGGDVNGRFGDPDVYGDTISFPLTTFQANAFNGGYDSDGDTVSWDVLCKPTFVLDYVIVWAYGTYAVTGAGTVDADLQVTISEPSPGRTWTDPLTSYPAFPLSGPPSQSGFWYGLSEMDLSEVVPAPGELLHVEMSTLLQVWTELEGSAEINTQYQDLTLNFTFVPEPGTLALLGLGILTLVRRRVH